VPSDASIDDNVGFTDDSTGQRISTWCGIGNPDVNDSVVAFAVFCGEHDDPEFEANIKLIASAPELYEALERVLAEFVDPQQGLDQFSSAIVRKSVERAQAALAKALGQ
jgi:hypothetical protein